MLSEQEAAAYVAALKAAASGSGSGTDKELAIIQTGATKGWDAARAMYEAMQKGVANPASLAEMKDGESKELGKTTVVGAHAGIGGNGDGMSVGIEGGYQVESSATMGVEKKDGAFIYTPKIQDNEKLSGGVNVGAGPAGQRRHGPGAHQHHRHRLRLRHRSRQAQERRRDAGGAREVQDAGGPRPVRQGLSRRCAGPHQDHRHGR